MHEQGAVRDDGAEHAALPQRVGIDVDVVIVVKDRHLARRRRAEVGHRISDDDTGRCRCFRSGVGVRLRSSDPRYSHECRRDDRDLRGSQIVPP